MPIVTLAANLAAPVAPGDKARRPLVFDGAMGTELYERGILYSACFEELCITKPEIVTAVHADYVLAGATVIETNTFGANRLRLAKHGYTHRVAELNAAAVKVARGAAGDSAYVVGSVGPSGYFLGDASSADEALVREALYEQACELVAQGVDGLFVETMRQTNELVWAVEACVRASEGKLPVFAGASLDEALRMSDGTEAHTIAARVRDAGAWAVAVNCSDGPMTALAAVEAMLGADLPVFALPNAGLPRRVDERLVYVATPEYFGVYARRMLKMGAAGVGGCCGTTPAHIRAVASAVRMFSPTELGDLPLPPASARESGEGAGAGALRPAMPFGERTPLAKALAEGRFVASVEVNPPVGLDPQKAVDAARMLKASGVKAINIADGARAQARMGNLALAVRIRREVDIECILHVCGRDRNLLGMLAHMLAAHELDVHNLVLITGDPPKMGDFPDASAVYDLDAIGLLKLAARLNRGVDPGGKSLGGVTRFVLATGAEPAALNYDREIKRLEEKARAGAEIVMTQPVYDARVVERFLSDTKHLNLKVLLGVLPIASHRNAEFLHNEVPGMSIPEDVRERMRMAGTGASARAEGVAIAREMLGAFRSRVQGVYVMPPLERYEMAVEVLDGFLEA